MRLLPLRVRQLVRNSGLPWVSTTIYMAYINGLLKIGYCKGVFYEKGKRGGGGEKSAKGGEGRGGGEDTCLMGQKYTNLPPEYAIVPKIHPEGTKGDTGTRMRQNRHCAYGMGW